MLIHIFLSTFLISLGSLLGILTLSIGPLLKKRLLLTLVALSAGTMLGGAFLHLLPEAIEALPAITVFATVIISYIIFFVVETVLHWHHCHGGDHDNHSLGTMNLIGDGVHNFIDGLIIAGAFLADFKLGVITTIAVALHEIPQEISDFGVLLYAGYERKRALVLNFLAALGVVAGGLTGFFLGAHIEKVVSYLLAFAAGGFIYIATSDLIPELKTENSLSQSFRYLAAMLLGVTVMALFKLVEIS